MVSPYDYISTPFLSLQRKKEKEKQQTWRGAWQAGLMTFSFEGFDKVRASPSAPVRCPASFADQTKWACLLGFLAMKISLAGTIRFAVRTENCSERRTAPLLRSRHPMATLAYPDLRNVSTGLLGASKSKFSFGSRPRKQVSSKKHPPRTTHIYGTRARLEVHRTTHDTLKERLYDAPRSLVVRWQV